MALILASYCYGKIELGSRRGGVEAFVAVSASIVNTQNTARVYILRFSIFNNSQSSLPGFTIIITRVHNLEGTQLSLRELTILLWAEEALFLRFNINITRGHNFEDLQFLKLIISRVHYY